MRARTNSNKGVVKKKPLNAIDMKSKVMRDYIAPLQHKKEMLKKTLTARDQPSGKYPKGTYKYSSTMRKIAVINQRLTKITRALDKKLTELN